MNQLITFLLLLTVIGLGTGCLVEYLSQKFLVFRGVVEGKPSALIKNGIVDREALRKNRMNINQLQSLLRQSETFSIREVAYCYLEANGSISILKKSKYQKTTQEEIRDGEVLWDEIIYMGFNESWLRSQLNNQNIFDYNDVFIAEWLQDDGLFVQPYKN
ncbi:DUF421 domain-containing protein [Peribacillus sp. V2I11]|uniref:DUF421 domain-containing protein n=1 Tax=Peribacillus sp. V2I11 TaxID=3042277 RepID=UPI0035947BA1